MKEINLISEMYAMSTAHSKAVKAVNLGKEIDIRTM